MLLHLAINYVFVTVFGWGFESVAWANSIAALNTCVLMAAYFVIFGKGYCIWGSGLTLQAFRVRSPTLGYIQHISYISHIYGGAA